MFHAQDLGSYAQGQGSLAVFKVTARDQGHYKGPSGTFVTYCNISCFFFSFFFFFKRNKKICPELISKHYYIALVISKSIFVTYSLVFIPVNIFLLMPGLRRHSVVQGYLNKIGAIFKKTVLGKSKSK